MKFQYMCNAGIVLTSEDIMIGIDCFCRDSNHLYQDTPDEACTELLKEIQESRLQALIFTHEHEDHFCAEYVREACQRSKALRVFAKSQVIHILRKEGVLEEQLIEIRTPCKKSFGEIQIEFIETLHEGEQYANVQNLTLLIKKEDKHLVITGDAAPTKELCQRIADWSKRVDWLFAPFPYVGLHSTRKLMKEYLDIKDIFVLHQPRQEADTQGWVESAKRVCEQAKDGLPQPIFPENLGEWFYL